MYSVSEELIRGKIPSLIIRRGPSGEVLYRWVVNLIAMSDQPVITIHFSRILIDRGRYIQRINLNRIIDELETEKIIPSPTAMALRGVNDEYEKSNLVIGILQGRNEKDFKGFLKIIAKEKTDSKFYESTKMFFSAFTMFAGYEQYATWPNGN